MQAATTPGMGGLTPRELEILQLSADGLSNKQIAARLYVSVETIKRHWRHIAEEFNVRHLLIQHRPRCIAEGFRRGLLR